MNTKTMRLPPRRVLTPSTTTNKRKERDDPFERPAPVSIPIPVPGPTSKLPKPDNKPITPRLGAEPIQNTAAGATTSKVSVSEPMMMPPSNQLLAGYLAHEYLTKGTLLGQPWVPAKTDGPTKAEDGEEGRKAAAAEEEERERYAEVAGLLRGGGTHLPGVVNPTQLARFLHL
ncbi:uncharacterized protein LOC130718558 [Lotus japonicus]|uniref:uncharacterized protein LOC130718558 n=1 Tax=Lotus japonicus TaxID=34305 RepID=UPI00258FE424|nr:uncharacterized protein LOC130718558 [Lotus japonicus]